MAAGQGESGWVARGGREAGHSAPPAAASAATCWSEAPASQVASRRPAIQPASQPATCTHLRHAVEGLDADRLLHRDARDAPAAMAAAGAARASGSRDRVRGMGARALGHGSSWRSGRGLATPTAGRRSHGPAVGELGLSAPASRAAAGPSNTGSSSSPQPAHMAPLLANLAFFFSLVLGSTTATSRVTSHSSTTAGGVTGGQRRCEQWCRGAGEPPAASPRTPPRLRVASGGCRAARRTPGAVRAGGRALPARQLRTPSSNPRSSPQQRPQQRQSPAAAPAAVAPSGNQQHPQPSRSSRLTGVDVQHRLVAARQQRLVVQQLKDHQLRCQTAPTGCRWVSVLAAEARAERPCSPLACTQQAATRQPAPPAPARARGPPAPRTASRWAPG